MLEQRNRLQEALATEKGVHDDLTARYDKAYWDCSELKEQLENLEVDMTAQTDALNETKTERDKARADYEGIKRLNGELVKRLKQTQQVGGSSSLNQPGNRDSTVSIDSNAPPITLEQELAGHSMESDQPITSPIPAGLFDFKPSLQDSITNPNPSKRHSPQELNREPTGRTGAFDFRTPKQMFEQPDNPADVARHYEEEMALEKQLSWDPAGVFSQNTSLVERPQPKVEEPAVEEQPPQDPTVTLPGKVPENTQPPPQASTAKRTTSIWSVAFVLFILYILLSCYHDYWNLRHARTRWLNYNADEETRAFVWEVAHGELSRLQGPVGTSDFLLHFTANIYDTITLPFRNTGPRGVPGMDFDLQRLLRVKLTATG